MPHITRFTTVTIIITSITIIATYYTTTRHLLLLLQHNAFENLKDSILPFELSLANLSFYSFYSCELLCNIKGFILRADGASDPQNTIPFINLHNKCLLETWT